MDAARHNLSIPDRALLESEDRHRAITELIPDAVFVHAEGVIVFANPASAKMFGAEEAIDLLGCDVKRFVHPDDLPLIEENWRLRGTKEQIEVVNARRLRLDGSVFDGESVHSSYTWDGAPAYLVMMRDVTERNRIQHDLAESEARYRKMANIMPDAVLVHAEDRILFANISAARMLGVASPEDMIGRNTFEFIPTDEYAAVMARRKAALTATHLDFTESRRLRSDGSQFWVETTGCPYIWEGRPAHLSIIRDISERKAGAAALESSELNFRLLAERSPDAVFVHRGGKFIFANPAAVQLFGAASESELHGLPVIDLVHADDHSKILDTREKIVRQTGPAPLTQIRRLRLDGSEFISEGASAAVIWGGEPALMATTRDVTARKADEDRLAVSEQRYRTMTSIAPDAIVIHVGGSLRYVNPAAIRVFGAHSAEQLVGLNIVDDLTHPDDRELILQQREKIVAGEPVERLEIRRQRLDGTSFISEGSGAPFKFDGEAAVLFIFNDITDRKLAEQKLERANKELENFAYVASHDLKEPLRMVASFCELLRERYHGKLDADADEFIGFAIDGAQRMQSLVDDLLKLSRMRSTDLVPSPVDSKTMVEEVVQMLTPLLTENGATVSYDDLPVVPGDRTLMGQVFQNLIVNAVKFQSDQPPHIDISATRHYDHWQFAVRDNGIGIAPDKHAQIFDVFKTLHSRHKFGGNGIGLSLCKTVIERHGGQIHVESTPGEGSCFLFTLPHVKLQDDTI